VFIPDTSEHFWESTIKASNTSKSVFFTGYYWLGRVVCPLTIHQELVLMFSFRQIQDDYNVIVASCEGKFIPVVEGPR
jgi:hypothetical protein